jgi:arsenite methyltransferase
MSMDIKTSVKQRYGARATAVRAGETSGCCDSGCCGDAPAGVNTFSEGIYAVDQLDGLPLTAALATLGCGNPTALAQLEPGEIVLDLGSGGGLDVILSARRVAPGGHAYGVDSTDEMLTLAWQNAQEAGIDNVTFLKGDIEHIPVPDASVDVVISNCVINLALDKDKVITEAFRVLKPGGRLAVTDVVVVGGLPDIALADTLRQDIAAWGSCIAGALSDIEYRHKVLAAGFHDIELTMIKTYTTDELFPGGLPEWAAQANRNLLDDLMGRFTSSFVRARRPA